MREWMLVVVVFAVVAVSVEAGGPTQWNCVYEVGGYKYDLTSANENPARSDGYYTAFGKDSDAVYYWKMCEGTPDPPVAYQSNYCDDSTFVCQTEKEVDFSTGEGPPTAKAYDNSGNGLILTALGGSIQNCGDGINRTMDMTVLCAPSAKYNGLTSNVDENGVCQYAVTLYLEAACGTKQ
uniref:MRH domain-containing protein n=1 Tax=Paramoeba aestuarina TaxID=180227 RepID=A0A7S4KHK8_9EUKA|mmetsp:Transcript_19427/g.30440  ORF Transcript_19427/g.30440 Transcript_19427/m.30440 type:complete len:180 (+) Transcript_19427:88-627(+)|eukprot:CAMPEP_0201511676 /NCGR_PEP_ID=MMETSP0161_2-20130828/4096_1 /ASSEMBLY_ACC=CAM_ASM_000251 /TAXON_ID=180227 /ORGANISM="Neoparamoeba aestuarina, Strain SoJaBio B1-5/56/2" /LENGTH=179 /DNA_ID=CAMNT_0047907261 /DNA_START=59 /DNA_END=598 /DNA_ORIENTATION=+